MIRLLVLVLLLLAGPAWGAEFLLERFTSCPTKPVCFAPDERVYEVVMEDDSPLSAKDRTPRVTTLTRIYTRGTMMMPREVLMTTGVDAQREIIGWLTSTTTEHGVLDLRGLGFQLTWGQDGRHFRTRRTFDVRIQPRRPGRLPVIGQTLDEYLR